jgi:acyl-CoA synthetase (AMP-forming)/AMP-acid ligase II
MLTSIIIISLWGRRKGGAVRGLTSDYQLILPAILRRAEALYGYREIVTRRPDKSFHLCTYADFVLRAKKLAVAIEKLGLRSGDRVGTFGWNAYQHLEANFASCWLPDAYEFVEELPMTAPGKFQKLKPREQFKDYQPARS